MQPVANLGSSEAKTSEAKTPEFCDITVGDILGPLRKKETGTGAGDAVDVSRDANFSLLSYSFSLVGPGSLES